MSGEAKLPASLSFEGNVVNNWRKFKQQFEIYLIASGKKDVDSEVKVAILLNIIGEDGLEVYNTFALNEQDKKKYEKVMEEYEKYMTPKVNIVYERFVFYRREQKEGETIDQFVQDLKKLVKTCDFGTEADNMVRDRIVLGVHDKDLQEKLLNLSNLSLVRAIEVAKNSEIMRQRVREVQQERQIEAVNKWKPASTRFKGKFEKAETKKNEEFQCTRCGYKHKARACPAFGKQCNKCKQKNHFAKMCRVKQVRDIQQKEEISDDESPDYVIDAVQKTKCKASEWYEDIKIKNKIIKFKLDTGAEANILPFSILQSIDNKIKVDASKVKLEAYGGFKLEALGTVHMNCTYKDLCVENVEFVVINTKSYTKPLLGVETCVDLGLVKRTFVINSKLVTENEFQKMYETNKDLFVGVGKFKDKLKIKLKLGVIPIAKPARRVPHSLRERLLEKLNKLEKEGIVEKVNKPSDWVSNLVIVEKPDKTIRICLDPQDLNQAIQREYHLIPTTEDIFVELRGKKYFTVLDLKDGFYHVPLDKESSELCTFSTPFGLYKFNRMPFGISVAPEYFQKTNEKNFGDIAGVNIYIDDLIISADSKEAHDAILNKVMKRARDLNVKFNIKKVQYRVESVKFLGYIFDKNGIQPDLDRIKAIERMEIPNDRKELQRLLGLINYFRKFIPNLSNLTANLRELIKLKNEFLWLPKHTEDVNKIKQTLVNKPVLAGFDSSKEINIQTDASKSGIGCCMLQDDKPVYFASRCMTDSECNYSQIEKELLGIVFAVQKFHNYIYGRRVTIYTDHKPLTSIMSKSINQIASSRLQRLKLKLVKYDLNVKFCPGKLLFVADTLSRSYLKDPVKDDLSLNEIVHSVDYYVAMSDKLHKKFERETEMDTELKLVKFYYLNGWPSDSGKIKSIKEFYNIKNEINFCNNIFHYQSRIIVPKVLRNEILNLLHEGHFGINKTLAKARKLYYWPKMSDSIRDLISKCKVCEKYRPACVKEPMISHELPSMPYQKVACDILQYGNKDYLAISDYYSNWIDIKLLKNKTSTEIISNLKTIFATHGIPQILVADNMPFNSRECKSFADDWGFKIVTTSPLYAKSNGKAEATVKIAKNILRKNTDLELSLLNYRSMPIEGIGLSPAEILMNRQLKNKLPIVTNLLLPQSVEHDKISDAIKNKRLLAKAYHDRTAKEKREFTEGENVVIKEGKVWVPGKIMGKCSTPRSYIVMNDRAKQYRRNSSFIKPSKNDLIISKTNNCVDSDDFNNNSLNNTVTNQTTTIRPKRNIIKPSKYNDYHLY